ncbi:PREDICTED: uncharacterized protein LOC104824641 [Tarenaya hassleriana]|uniref:uncharacterized protein LOC104824641 n=1 Tax=Tarenaya hassleriana TaxID=28532 RepID=UPI00053C633D|nr:PREDICTED: uncharacterized protein LOC104824641 [Tarenaya hassleriana]
MEASKWLSLLLWQVKLQRLPTTDRLSRWGVQVDSVCQLYGLQDESHFHLFFECPYSYAIWSHFAGCCDDSPPSDLGQVQSWSGRQNRGSERNKGLISKILSHVTVDMIWKERNDRIFKEKVTTIRDARTKLDRQMRTLLLSVRLGSNAQHVRLFEDWYFLMKGLR